MSFLISRRSLFGSMAVGLGSASVSGWFPAFAEEAARQQERGRHFILLWMSGGPAQTDTFDLKPGHANGGEFQEIQTASPGLRFSEHLPKLATMSQNLAVLRGMSTREGDHGRGTYLMRTGHLPQGALMYPSLGASMANQLGRENSALPHHVSIGAYRAFNQDAFGAGFLGPKYGPLVVAASDMPGVARAQAQGYPELKVQSIDRSAGIGDDRMNKRLGLWQGLQQEFLAGNRGNAAQTHNAVYAGAVQLMNSKEAKAFDLSTEPEKLRDEYGRTVFGQGCLLARRLIEHGVAFVEVSLGTNSGGVGWDTHADNFNAIKNLSSVLDSGWSTLMKDLADRGLLDSTTILWMGEFGRTPQINATVGRDHYPHAWSTVIAGGGVAGGQAWGKTSPDGVNVIDGEVSTNELLATVFHAVGVGVNGRATQIDPAGRPIPLADGEPIKAVLL